MLTQRKKLYGASELLELKDQWIRQFAAAGFPLIPLVGQTKIPLASKWTQTAPDPSLTGDDFADNYGVVLRPNIVVIDVDPKNFGDGDPFARLKEDAGLSADEHFDTFIVQSRAYSDEKAGYHIYFSKPLDVDIKMHAPRYGKGIEAKTFGHQLVGPGSIHPDTLEPYIVVHGQPDQLMLFPESLLKIFSRASKAEMAKLNAPTDDEDAQERFRAILSKAHSAVEGQHGDEYTFKLACRGRDLGLSELTTFELMRDCYNAKCVPPWPERQLAAKVQSAYRNGKKPFGNEHPKAAFTAIDPASQPEKSENEILIEQIENDRLAAEEEVMAVWDGLYDANGRIRQLKSTIDNVKNHFIVPSKGAYKNPFYQMIRMNQFGQRIEFQHRAPWHPKSGPLGQWTNSDTTQFRAYLSRVRRFNPTRDVVLEGVISYAEDRAYHPVRDYYRSLTWDGKPRVDSLFTFYCGAEDSEYTRAAARCTMVAMIARIMQPGCQHDHVPILEGAQAAGKSSFCRILGGPWYRSLHLNPHNKDTVMSLQGVLVVELAEMTHTRKEDVDSIKAFITSTTDAVRKPYGVFVEDLPRQNIFIGTVNPREFNTYMPDQTGNRRFWPIATGGFKLEDLKRDRDQLFAEAYAMWQSGEPHHFTNPQVIAAAMREQALRTDRDSWADVIQDFLLREHMRGQIYETVTTNWVAERILNVDTSRLDNVTSRRIANSMRTLGWEICRKRTHEGQVRAWRNPRYQWQLGEVLKGV